MDVGTRVAVLRRLGLVHNDMRRRSDRLESAVLLATLALALLVVPVAAAVASSVAGGTAAEVAEVEARSHPVTGRTLEAAPAAPGTPAPVRVRVEWSQDGVPHRGQELVPRGTPVGSPVVVRVDAAGAPVDGPEAGDVTRNAAAAGIGILVVSWAGLLAAVVGTRLLLDRARMRAWGTEWEEIEPPWRREQI